MTNRPGKACVCGGVISSAGSCNACGAGGGKRMPDGRPSAYKRGYGSDWKALADSYKRSVGMRCERCGKTEGLQVHHVTPFRGIEDPNRLDPHNLECLCAACHSKEGKTV